MKRRTVLAVLGGTTATVLAGCVADETPAGGEDTPTESPTDEPTETPTDQPARSPTDDPTETPTDGPTSTPTDEPRGTGVDGAAGENAPTDHDADPTVVSHDVETAGAECMSGGESDHVDVRFGSEGVTLDGLAAAPNPCHEATIESATVEAGELRVRIGLDSTDGMCAQCVGAVAYSAEIEIDGVDGLDAVTVEHGDDGEAHTVSRGETAAPSPTPSPTPREHSSRHAAQEPDPDLPIYVESTYDETAEVAVTVARESGETVYDETITVEPASGRVIYNLKEADPDGIEAFDVRAATGGQTESVRVETSACYGSVDLMVEDDGSLFLTYSIC